jgi:hypothetical protein
MIKKGPMIKKEPMIKEEAPEALNIYSIKKEDEEEDEDEDEDEDEEEDEKGEEGLVVKRIGAGRADKETRELEFEVEWKGRDSTIETKAAL